MIMGILNTMPQLLYDGIEDNSMSATVFNDIDVPQHYPLLYLQTEKGQEFSIVAMGDASVGGLSASAMLGAKTFDKRGKFYNHQTMLAEIFIKNGNSFMVRRVSTDAKLASVTLLATLTTTEEAPYLRDTAGIVQVGTSGELLVNTDPEVLTVSTLSISFSLVPTSTLVNVDGEISFTPINNSVYPILTIDASSKGEHGNNIGFKLIPFRTNGNYVADTDVINHQKALIFGAQLFQKDDLGVSNLLYDNYSDDTTEFSFKPNAYNYKYNTDLTLQNLIDNYMNNGFDTGGQPVFGPLGKITEHTDNIVTVLNRMLAKEMVANEIHTFTETDTFLMNLLAAKDINNVHYYAVRIAPASLKFGENYTHWLSGGDDGDTSLAAYDAAVAREVQYNCENPDYPLLSVLKYPFSHVWDSGFTMPTKIIMGSWLGKRKDVNFIGTVCVQGEKPPTQSEALSRALFIRNSLELIPESVMASTPACRVSLVDQAGIDSNISTKVKVPQLFDFAEKKARYFGASNGKLRSIHAYDEDTNKLVTTMRDITGTWGPYVGRVQTWNTGLIHSQPFSQTRYFYPAFPTLYPFKNSILNSEIYVHIVTDVVKKAHICWARLTGSGRLSSGASVAKMKKETFIKKSNDLILELTDGLYDNRVEIVPNTYFTPNDDKLGISWNLAIKVKGVIPLTIMELHVEAARYDATGYVN